MDNVPSDEDYWKPLYFSTIAGASTCIGAAIVFPLRKQEVSPQLMSFSMALAGSVMITISVISIGPECLHGAASDMLIAFERAVSFGVGCGLYILLSKYALPEPPEEILGDKLASLDDNNQNYSNSEVESLLESSIVEDVESSPTLTAKKDSSNDNETTVLRRRPSKEDIVEAEVKVVETEKMESSLSHNELYWGGHDLDTKDKRRAWRVGLLLFVSLLVHNFPEGLAVAATTIKSPSLGITVTIGIMIHNIPEGIAIAIPCHAARPNQPWLSFALASVSGLAEPLGALVALLFLRNIGDDPTAVLSLENILAFVAGTMTTVAVFELIPEGRRYHTGWPFWSGMLSGFVVMFITEVVIDT